MGSLLYAGGIAPALSRPLRVAAFAALAFAANVAESFVALPAPFLRLGLANAFVLLALWNVGPAAAFTVAAVKAVGAALVVGTLFSPVFGLNAGGTLVSWGVMSLVAWAAGGRPSFIVVASALAGAAHGCWQALYVGWWAGSGFAAPLAAFLVPWGLATGVAVGAAASSLRRRVRREVLAYV